MSSVLRPLTALLLLAACSMDGGSDSGDMNPPQESVSDGTMDLKANIEIAVTAGSGVLGLSAGDVADGWTITIDKYLVTLGSVVFIDPNGTPVTHAEDAVIDLRQLTTEPGILANIEIPAGTSQVRFTIPEAQERFSAFETTAPADRQFMADNAYSIYVEGRLEKQGGLTCATNNNVPVCTPAPVVTFRWGLTAGAQYDGCPAIDADPNAELQATITLPGDRWFLTGFTDGEAAPPVLRAQWIANGDLDRDGETTLDELTAIKASTLLPRDLGYDFADAPIPIATARDYVEAQARTLGRHALGLCPTSSPL